MKKSGYFLLLTTMIFSSCTVAEQDNPLVVPSCDAALVKNRITLNATNIVMSAGNIVYGQKGSYYEISISTPEYAQGSKLVIQIADKIPPGKNMIYSIVPDNKRLAGQASVTVTNIENFKAQSGELFVYTDGKQVTIKFCSLALTASYDTIGLSGNIVCK